MTSIAEILNKTPSIRPQHEPFLRLRIINQMGCNFVTPKAIIAEDSLAPVLSGFKSLGFKSGQDIVLAVRGALSSDATYAGMNQRAKDVGATAVATLAGMLQRNERGIPAIPQQLLLESFWQSERFLRQYI